MAKSDVNYLRVSITDRCNLRCVYCNPLDEGGLLDRTEVLDVKEIHHLVRLCTERGITRVRLTGGEPLVRRDIISLVRMLASVPKIEDLSLTTNGLLLAPMAAALKQAGLQRVNISLDAAETQCFHHITQHDGLAEVVKGLREAIAVGLDPVRINCVVLRPINLSQIPVLAEMSVDLPVSVRFIEYCPPGRAAGHLDWYVSNDEVLDLIESRLGVLAPVAPTHMGGPAVYRRAQNACGTIGFISGRSSMFCHRCQRLRLTCDGKLRPCLHSEKHYDLRTLMRSGAGDNVLRSAIERAFREKSRYTKRDKTLGGLSMQHVGG